jgi:hypothetical protein
MIVILTARDLNFVGQTKAIEEMTPYDFLLDGNTLNRAHLVTYTDLKTGYSLILKSRFSPDSGLIIPNTQLPSVMDMNR